jgi:hypothetical protein
VFLVVVVVRRHPVEDQAALRHVPQTAASVRRNGTDGVPAVLPGPRRAGSEGEAGLRERNLDNRGREEEEARRPQSDRPRAVLRQQGSRVESAGQVADRLRAVHGQGQSAGLAIASALVTLGNPRKMSIDQVKTETKTGKTRKSQSQHPDSCL